MSYNGGKGGAGVYQKIINAMPKHNVYIETHLGGGSIMRKKKIAAASIGIDIDTAVINSFKYSIDILNDTPASAQKAISPGMSTNVKLNDGTLNLVNMDCVEFLQRYEFKGDELIYCDPPYLFETRKSKQALYRHEYTAENHIELLNILLELPCLVMISGYKSSLYMEVLDKWHYKEFTAQTRRGAATESLWMNFNPDEHIKHDLQYIGDNFRERERIKRKGNRWIKNLKKMPSDERDFILRSIIDEYDVGISC